VKAGLPVAVIDPIGVWWGLRADAAGTGPGLPLVVFGGDHGDLALEANAGEAIADAIVDLRPPAVIDLSLLRKGEQQRFVMAFAERLYHRNRAPLHLVLDEADAWAPQRPVKGTERLLGAVEDLVRRGRARGLGVTLITQRPAVLHKDVLTQVQVLIALRMVAPHDREAIDAWVRVHGTPEQRDELVASLPSLPVGNAWVWSPGWLHLFQRVAIRRRETFDSSATPKVGEERIAPRQLASVDLKELRAKIATTLENVEQDDPRALRQRTAELERQVQSRSETRPVVERVEIPVVDEAMVARLERGTRELKVATRAALELLQPLIGPLHESVGDLLGAIGRVEARPVSESPTGGVERARVTRAADQQASGERLKPGQRRMLEALARRHPGRLTAPQLGALSRMSHKGGSFNAYVAELQRWGLIDVAGDVGITEAGFDEIGMAPAADPQSPAEALAMWRAVLPGSAVRVLDALVAAYPAELSREQLAEQTGYASGGGSFGAAIGLLRKYGLAERNARQLRANKSLVDRSISA
jgi:uncharacterized protein